MNIKGIIPALVTPFDENYQVDYDALKVLVERLIVQGVGGFYACGSTAECFLMTDEERKKVLETVIKAANNRVPVIAHIGNIGSEKSCELARHATEAGASAISSVPPFYYNFSFDEITSYYADLSKASELPLIVYNIPAFSGVEINAENLQKIIDYSGAKGLKYTSYNLFELERIRRAFPDIKLFNGHDEVYSNALPIGIDGAIGSTFNVLAEKFISLGRLYEENDMDAVSAKQHELNEIIDVLIKVGVNAGIKYWLTKSGIPCGDCRRPFAALTEDKKALLDQYFNRICG